MHAALSKATLLVHTLKYLFVDCACFDFLTTGVARTPSTAVGPGATALTADRTLTPRPTATIEPQSVVGGARWRHPHQRISERHRTTATQRRQTAAAATNTGGGGAALSCITSSSGSVARRFSPHSARCGPSSPTCGRTHAARRRLLFSSGR